MIVSLDGHAIFLSAPTNFPKTCQNPFKFGIIKRRIVLNWFKGGIIVGTFHKLVSVNYRRGGTSWKNERIRTVRSVVCHRGAAGLQGSFWAFALS